MKKNVIISAIGVMILFLTSAGFAQERVQMKTAPVQKPQLAPERIQQVQIPKGATFEVAVSQKLQQLRAREELKKKSDVQRRDQVVSRIRNVPLRKPCEVPTIQSVYPAEVYPYSPILIEGCGFQSQDGSKAVMLAPNYKDRPFYVYQPSSEGGSHPVFPELLIDSWTDTTIKARIPPLYGYPNPISFTLKVLKGYLGQDRWKMASAPSSNILLKPEMEIGVVQGVENWITPVVKSASYWDKTTNKPSFDTSHCVSIKDKINLSFKEGAAQQAPKIVHFSLDAGCKGRDQIPFQYMKLNNNWVFYDHSFYYDCMQFTPSGAGSISNCHEPYDYGKSAKLDQNLGNIKGMTSLPKVTVIWEHRQSGGIAYSLIIIGEGPKGTFP